MAKEERNDASTKLGISSILLLILSGLFILFSFVSPWLFTLPTKLGINLSETGQIGDTISGVMSPFIGISGVMLTFLAFFIQFKANKLQHDQFRTELDAQKLESEKNTVESQFYEMLRLHKENVNDLKIVLTKSQVGLKGFNYIEHDINGRQVFDLLKDEFEICFFISQEKYPELDIKLQINEAYGLFFLGLNEGSVAKHEYFKTMRKIQQTHAELKFRNLSEVLKTHPSLTKRYSLKYDLFRGHSSQLAHYYRHLYQTVKFIAYQREELLSYVDKRKYLRMLRAQLSNQEQAMLFYNWLSKFGKQWENEKNHFFTDFRMIHNVYNDLLFPEIQLENIEEFNRPFKKEPERDQDPLFEFEDW
jgi:hypothetical protein